MNIKKIGHCCLVIKINGLTVLTDPGTFTTEQDTLTGIDIVLVSHEHGDHFHIDSVKKIMANNPNAKIVTNSAVGKLLEAEGLKAEIVGEGQKNDTHGVLIEGYGHLHAEIYGEIGQCENTAYMLDGKLYYPGDAFFNPERPIDILALPVGGPWMKLSEAIDYAVALKPRATFPVHDAMFKNPSFMYGMLAKILGDKGIGFLPMNDSDQKDF